MTMFTSKVCKEISGRVPNPWRPKISTYWIIKMSLLHDSRWLIWKQRLKSFVFSWSAGCVFSTPINCNKELGGWELSGCLSFLCQPAPCFLGRGFKHMFVFIPTLWNDPIWQKACFSTWVENHQLVFRFFSVTCWVFLYKTEPMF